MRQITNWHVTNYSKSTPTYEDVGPCRIRFFSFTYLLPALFKVISKKCSLAHFSEGLDGKTDVESLKLRIRLFQTQDLEQNLLVNTSDSR